MRNILPYDIRKNFTCPLLFLISITARRSGSSVRFVFRDKRTQYEKLPGALGRKTLLGQRFYKILCAVYTLVNHETNPESLIELISQRETSYALRGKEILTMPKVNTTRFGLKS